MATEATVVIATAPVSSAPITLSSPLIGSMLTIHSERALLSATRWLLFTAVDSEPRFEGGELGSRLSNIAFHIQLITLLQ